MILDIKFKFSIYSQSGPWADQKVKGEGTGQVCFVDGPFDLKNGSTILEFQQERRSVYHSDFMRPFVNRWPIISEPLSDQAEATADLVDFPKFFWRKTEIKQGDQRYELENCRQTENDIKRLAKLNFYHLLGISTRTI